MANRTDKWPTDALKRLGELLADPGKVWGLSELDLPHHKSGDQLPKGEERKPALAGAPVPPVLQGFDPLADDTLKRLALRSLLLEAIRFHKRELERAEINEGHTGTTAREMAQ